MHGKNVWRFYFFIILCSWFSLFGANPLWAEENEIILVVNDQQYIFGSEDAKPCVMDDRLYVPLRVVGQALGHHVDWEEASQQVFITTKDASNEITVSENTTDTLQLVINGRPLLLTEAMGMPYVSQEGFTMIPLRAVGEALDCRVEWQDNLVIVQENTKAVEVSRTEGDSHISPATLSGNQGIETPDYQLTIIGENIAAAAQMKEGLAAKEPVIRQMMAQNYPEKSFIPFDYNLIDLYLEIGAKYHIRGDLAFAQALKETGYFQFYGSVQPFQNNFCGLGATGVALTGEEPLNGVNPARAMYIPGTHGITFSTAADGVEAHIQHLYAYATKNQLPNGCQLVDPRFQYVSRGVSVRWIDLDGRWAVPGVGYGESIIDDYWKPLTGASV